MSKSKVAATWLGGASVKKTCADAVAIVPHITMKQIPFKIYGKLIYVHADCAEHKQMRTAARKNEKLVQETVSHQEAR